MRWKFWTPAVYVYYITVWWKWKHHATKTPGQVGFEYKKRGPIRTLADIEHVGREAEKLVHQALETSEAIEVTVFPPFLLRVE